MSIVPQGVRVFLDTNILLRYSIADAPMHKDIRQVVEKLHQAECTLWISRQVIREFSVVITRPQTFGQPATSEQAVEQVRALLGFFSVIDEDRDVTESLFALMKTHPMGGKQIHDANIVACMQTRNVPNLLTLNVADFKRFTPAITILEVDQLKDARTSSDEDEEAEKKNVE